MKSLNFNKSTTKPSEILKGLSILALAVIVAVAPFSASAAKPEENEKKPDTSYTITINPASPVGATVSVSGDVSVVEGIGGGSDQYDVQVFWDAEGDTSNKTDTSTTNFTDGKTFTGTWSNSHTYTTSGTYKIKAKLYHGNVNGNDADAESSTIEITIVIAPPAPETGTLTVNKVVVGGTATTSDFQLLLDGSSISSGVATTTTAGSHTVSEVSTPDYTGVFSGDCDAKGLVTVSSSTPAICTITNTFTGTTTPPDENATSSTLRIIKTVINDNGGTSTASDFLISLFDGSATSTFKGSETGTAFVLGTSTTYSVTEPSYAGYTATFSPNCSGTILAGQSVICTVTNNDAPSDNNGGGDNEGGGNDDSDNTSTSTPTTVIAAGGAPTGGRTGGGSIISGFSLPASGGEVLGATTDEGSSCSYLNSYMKMGLRNSLVDVVKLQLFLNENLGSKIVVNGIFGTQTETGVKELQVKYGQQILGPWVSAGLHPNTSTPTGYVYKTTKWWINTLKCPSVTTPAPILP